MTSTRAKVKQEPQQDILDAIMNSDTPSRSSGSTIRNDDVMMVNGHGTRCLSSDGYVEDEQVDGTYPIMADVFARTPLTVP